MLNVLPTDKHGNLLVVHSAGCDCSFFNNFYKTMADKLTYKPCSDLMQCYKFNFCLSILSGNLG